MSKTMSEERERIVDLIEELPKRINAPWITRPGLFDATGGALHPKTEANRDSLGIGIKGSFKMGGKVCYPINSVVERLKEMAGVCDV